ncbi:MAG: hypothetical protein L6Q37_00140 [Bdellovibrionaceae bacterium]|nr:hypothetical protein [Pseudobdellovibrionaceae bacterium]NUM57544.1 hypothetical protein [Pseudobdellovibrionaceae bacterium]
MKTFLIVPFFLISSISFAKNECINSAYKIAKVNMDLKAISYGDEASDLITDPVEIKEKNDGTQTTTFEFYGYINNKNYSALVTVDSLCSIESIFISEIKK